MVIESRMIVGAAAAFALVGGVLWGSAVVLAPPAQKDIAAGTVEVTQVPERSWAVEIKDLGAMDAPVETARTVAKR